MRWAPRPRATDRRQSRPHRPTLWFYAYRIDGAVRDADGGQALDGALIAIAGGANQGKSAVADDQGRYQIAELEPGAVVIHAVADGFDLQSQSVTLSSNQTLDFVLRRAPATVEPSPERWNVSGTVSDAGTRSALGRAHVAVFSGPDRGATAETDSRGHYSLSVRPGTFSVEASADAFESERHNTIVASDAILDFALTVVPAGAPTGPVVKGTTVNGVSNDRVAGAMIRVDGGAKATSAGDGTFELAFQAPASVLDLTIRSSSTVERSTRLRVADSPATLTLIPTTLDLGAFDQMFRGDQGVLRRWTTAPSVVVQRRVLRFTGVDDGSFVATATVLSDDEIDDLLDDLLGALPHLTGDTFGRFANRSIETAAEGERVAVTRSGTIVVAEYEGLAATTTYWGYTRWAWNERGEVRAGSMMLDRAFETSGSPYRRSLRSHELGHALGYNHVNARVSVMNISARVLPNDFDRDGSRIAFLRPPLNVTPDIDPDPITVNRAPASGLTWTGDH